MKTVLASSSESDTPSPPPVGWMPSQNQWLKFFEELSLTNEAGVLPSSTYDKLFVLAYQSSEIEGPWYFLYYFDLSSACKDSDNSIQSWLPILQFVGGDYYVYAVVGSKLYMFGGQDIRDAKHCFWSVDWGYYDFSSNVKSPPTKTANLKKRNIITGPPMKGRKFCPIAAVVGEGGYKICVFGTLIYDKAEAKNPGLGPPTFEVLDTRTNTWTELPELPVNYRRAKLDRIFIRSYCIERFCLIICTDIGVYGINVDAEKPGWVKMRGSEKLDVSPFSGRWTVVGKNVCNPGEVARMGEVETCRFALKHKRGSLKPECGVGFVCSERVENGVILCSVQGKVVEGTDWLTRTDAIAYLFVNVVKFDSKLEELRGDKWKRIQSEKASIFKLDFQSCRVIGILGVFPFKEATENSALEDDKKRSNKTTGKRKRPTGQHKRRS